MQKKSVATWLQIICVAVASILLFGCAEKASEATVDVEKVNAFNNIAMDGFDVVAYHKQNKPVKGDAQFTVDYKGKRWLFNSAENAEAFAQNTAAFEPQFNGWCAYAVSEGYAAEVDFVNGWAVLDGKLYLNWDADVRDEFVEEQVTRRIDASNNWSKVHAGIVDGSVGLYTHADEGAGITHPQQP